MSKIKDYINRLIESRHKKHCEEQYESIKEDLEFCKTELLRAFNHIKNESNNKVQWLTLKVNGEEFEIAVDTSYLRDIFAYSEGICTLGMNKCDTEIAKLKEN